MTLTKRNKVLFSVFGVGLMALVADRTILRPQGGPAAASASQSEDSERPSAGAAAPEEQQPEIDMADRLGVLWSGREPVFEQVRNPFSLPTTWFETSGVAEERIPDICLRFIRTHRLTAIGMQGGESYIMVDDQFLVPGRRLDGFTLASVGDRSAVFEREGRQAVLELIVKE
jgi:hypothetical protein